MPPHTFLTLPTELRQLIVEKTLYTSSKGKGTNKGTKNPYLSSSEPAPIQFYTISPLYGVCKSLQADLDKVFQSWLPDPVTGSLTPVCGAPPLDIEENGWIIRKMAPSELLEFDRSFAAHATKLGKAWPGVQELHAIVFDISQPDDEFREWEGSMLTDGGILIEHLICRLSSLLARPSWMLHLPETVKCVKLDFTISPSLQKVLDTFEPGGSLEPPKSTYGSRFFYRAWFWHIVIKETRYMATVKHSALLRQRAMATLAKMDLDPTPSNMYMAEQLNAATKIANKDFSPILNIEVLGELDETHAEALAHLPSQYWEEIASFSSGDFFYNFIRTAKERRKVLEAKNGDIV